MSLPTVVKTWTYSPNNRITYVSLNATMAALLYGIKNFLVATMSYTVKYTCDGTTGPTSSSDHTDRWASVAACLTRGANSTSAQSFCVLTDGSGCDVLLTYQGSGDDVAILAFNPLGAVVPAGTATNEPTSASLVTVVSGTA